MYKYKLIPCTEVNLQKIPTAQAVLPLVSSEWRSQIMLAKDGLPIILGRIVCGINYYWMFNLLEIEVATFDLIGFENVQSFDTSPEVLDLFTNLYQ